MFIPALYLLLSAEIIFILFAFSIGLLVYVYRLSNKEQAEENHEISDNELEEAFDLSTTYAEYLEIEVERNQKKFLQDESNSQIDEVINEDDESEDELDDLDTDDESSSIEYEQISDKEKSAQHELLRIREMFLTAEKMSANYQNHEINFWDSVYKNMSNIVEELSTVIQSKQSRTHMDVESDIKPEVKEKVFYIETQGKKIDGEVNKLKDIIHDQENALNALKKSVSNAEDSDIPQELIDEIQAQITALEAQLGDSKMCMEVLEMENNRLQDEVNQLEAQYMQDLSESSTAEVETQADATIDLSELQDMVHKQKSQIENLNSTIDELQIDASLAQKMKDTIGDFARSGQEMMGCISILEEENKHFKFLLSEKDDDEDNEAVADENEAITDIEVSDNTGMEELKTQIESMEEEITKKDVAFAQLQAEFESIEKEYLSMYEAMHGDN